MNWTVPLSKEEFDKAKAGEFVIIGTFLKGHNLGVLIIGNKEMSDTEMKKKFHGILANGDDVYYVNIAEWDWEQLNNPELDRFPYIKFSDGVGFLFLSKELNERIKQEADA